MSLSSKILVLTISLFSSSAFALECDLNVPTTKVVSLGEKVASFKGKKIYDYDNIGQVPTLKKEQYLMVALRHLQEDCKKELVSSQFENVGESISFVVDNELHSGFLVEDGKYFAACIPKIRVDSFRAKVVTGAIVLTTAVVSGPLLFLYTGAYTTVAGAIASASFSSGFAGIYSVSGFSNHDEYIFDFSHEHRLKINVNTINTMPLTADEIRVSQCNVLNTVCSAKATKEADFEYLTQMNLQLGCI